MCSVPFHSRGKPAQVKKKFRSSSGGMRFHTRRTAPIRSVGRRSLSANNTSWRLPQSALPLMGAAVTNDLTTASSNVVSPSPSPFGPRHNDNIGGSDDSILTLMPNDAGVLTVSNRPQVDVVPAGDGREASPSITGEVMLSTSEFLSLSTTSVENSHKTAIHSTNCDLEELTSQPINGNRTAVIQLYNSSCPTSPPKKALQIVKECFSHQVITPDPPTFPSFPEVYTTTPCKGIAGRPWLSRYLSTVADGDDPSTHDLSGMLSSILSPLAGASQSLFPPPSTAFDESWLDGNAIEENDYDTASWTNTHRTQSVTLNDVETISFGLNDVANMADVEAFTNNSISPSDAVEGHTLPPPAVPIPSAAGLAAAMAERRRFLRKLHKKMHCDSLPLPERKVESSHLIIPH